MPGAAVGATVRPGGGLIRFERSSLLVQVAVGGAVFFGWDAAEPSPSHALPGAAPEPDTRAVLEPDKDGGWRLVSERTLVTVSRHGTVEVRTPGGELLRRDLPPRWWETSAPEDGDRAGGPAPEGSAARGTAGEPAGGAESSEPAGSTEGSEPAGGRGAVNGQRRTGAGAAPGGRGGRWMHRSQVPADARFFGLGGRTGGPGLPDGSYPLHGCATVAQDEAAGGATARQTDAQCGLAMPVQLVVADAGTHMVFHDNAAEGQVTVRRGLEGRGSGHDRPGHSQIRLAAGPLRYWVLAGPPARVLHGWAGLTGAPALPPGWALGYQHRTEDAGPGGRPEEIAAGYRRHGLPLRAVHPTGPAVRPERGGGHRVRAGRPPAERDPRAPGPWLPPEPAYQGAESGSREARSEETRPGEEYGGTRDMAAGTAGVEQQHEALHGSPFALMESGWAGMQRVGGAWGGEVTAGWEGLRESLSVVVSLGLCGVPYSGPPVAGRGAGAPSAELYLRWFQLAAYLPLFHVHVADGTGAREPWALGDEVRSGCVAAMAERERLRPYFTTLAHLAHRTGAPFVRPLWWRHPRERALRDCDDAFLLGDALLVAPVLEEGARRRTVRLPHGRWHETVTGEVHEGPGEVLLDAPLSRLPVLARAGAAVPVRGPDGATELEVWPPAPGRTGKGLVIEPRDARRAQGRPPAERFTVLRRGGGTVVTREDGAPVGYPVRLRS